MYIAERMFLRGHKNHFWILCHGIYTKNLGYVDSLKSWLAQWRLNMNAKKCCYTIFSNGGRGDLEFNLTK